MTVFDAKLREALGLLEMAQLSRYETRGIQDRGDWKVSISMAVPHVDRTWTFPASTADTKEEMWEVFKKALAKEFGPMYWKKLHSSSPEDLKPYVTFSQSPSFNRRDVKALLHPKTQQAIEAFLNKNPDGYKWNFILVDENITMPEIIRQADERKADINRYMAELYGIETDGHITFIKKQSSGDVLDAHMLTHSLAHATLSNHHKNSATMDHCRSALKGFAQSLVGDYSRNREKELEAVAQFMHMTAAKSTLRARDESLGFERQQKLGDRGLINMDEAVHEMFAVFVRRGQVKFRPNEFCEYTQQPAVLERARQIEDDFNQKFRIALDRVVGDFVVD